MTPLGRDPSGEIARESGPSNSPIENMKSHIFVLKAFVPSGTLGIAALEAKIVQQAVVIVLNQAYEVDFLDQKTRTIRKPGQALFRYLRHHGNVNCGVFLDSICVLPRPLEDCDLGGIAKISRLICGMASQFNDLNPFKHSRLRARHSV